MTVNESMSAADMGLTEQHRTFESSHLAIYESEAGDMTVECIHDDDSRDVFATFPGCGDEIDVVRDLISEINRLRDSTATLQADLAAAVDERDRAQASCSAAFNDALEREREAILLRSKVKTLETIAVVARAYLHAVDHHLPDLQTKENNLIAAVDALPQEAP